MYLLRNIDTQSGLAPDEHRYVFQMENQTTILQLEDDAIRAATYHRSLSLSNLYVETVCASSRPCGS
jgi:hypothetical protein